MPRSFHVLETSRIGLALSGGSARGLAHIGVYKALSEAGVRPSFIAGTSAGSVVGAGIAAGMTWRELTELARGVFWPSLLHGSTLERFCARHLPADFSGLQIPFVAVATTLPDKLPVAIRTGPLASAISASCAMRVIRRRVRREDKILKDGGIARALPADFCRHLGAEFVIGSDVWELSSLLRGIGVHPAHPKARRLYPHQYHVSLRHTDLLIQPRVPFAGYWPGEDGIQRMIAAGYRAAQKAFDLLAA